MVKKVIIGLTVVFAVMQFFRIDKTNPETNIEMDLISISNPPEKVKEILRTSCYDCHSNEVKYPWYSNVAPVSWLVKHDIDEGRGHLNFSTWGNYSADKKDHKLEECYEEVEEGEMPMKIYTVMHSESKLSDEDRAMLVDWFKSQR